MIVNNVASAFHRVYIKRLRPAIIELKQVTSREIRNTCGFAKFMKQYI